MITAGTKRIDLRSILVFAKTFTNHEIDFIGNYDREKVPGVLFRVHLPVSGVLSMIHKMTRG
jgi:hypothetical protein